MKKYLFSALALPLLFACSSEDFDEKVISNDQFAGIEKVNATFTMDEGPITRMDSDWELENGDLYGFAWLGDGTIIKPDDATNGGKAFQNHNLIQTSGRFEPQTSIYVGSYYIYRPYDKTTVSPQAINFKSLETQTLKDGKGGQAWRDLAKNAIIIGDKWTEIVPEGHTYGTDPTVWDKPGIGEPYKVYAAIFSNQTALDLSYLNNNVSFAGKTINGATDINYTYPEDATVGAAGIYSITVDLDGSAKSFTYAPKVSPNDGAHSGTFWADKSGAAGKGVEAANGFTFTDDVITLNAPNDAEDGITTEKASNKGWFWFNSLPVTAGNATSATNVQTVLNTSYGVLTLNKTLAECAYAYEIPTGYTQEEWIKLAAATNQTKTPKEWQPDEATKYTFVNQYGNHVGKYALTADFKDAVMTDMHIKNDRHLQKLLKFYISSGKTENVSLNLDGASETDKTFKLSKISIALLQTINAAGHDVKVHACATHNNPVKIIVTQDGQADLGLSAATEVPDLNNVFDVATDVYLSSAYTWTWKERTAPNQLTIDAKVSRLINEGTLTVNATNVQLSVAASTLANAKGATMNITKVTTVKNALTNLGTINVGDNTEDGKKAELRAYDVEITNDAKEKLMPADLIAATVPATAEVGLINNYGVVGVSDVGTSGKFNNYGLIDVKDAGAITLLTTNQVVTNFDNHFDATNNKMGTVNLPSPTALVSVANLAANGFILYNWPAGTKTYVTPEGNVKYNTIVVSGDIEFTVAEPEIQYLMFNSERTQVINLGGYLTQLKGVIVNAGKSIIIEKDNKLNPMSGTFLGAGATVYKGGQFTHNANVVGTTASNYFGDWETTQIVKF